MTFTETLTKLYEETEHTQIYALISFGDAKFGIGFRRSCVNSPYRDPIIDDTVFMLCADARDTYYNASISTTTELQFTNLDDIEINLRAQSGTFPFCTIDLGRFKVNTRKVIEYYNEHYPSRIYLDISRIH